MFRNGKRVFSMVKDVHVVFGKGRGSQQVPNDENGHAPNAEEEVHTMGAPILGSLGGLQCNRCDALDEESLREPARIPWYVWALKRYTRSKDVI